MPDIAITDRSLIWNSDLIETLEFDNLIIQAVVTMDSAVAVGFLSGLGCKRRTRWMLCSSCCILFRPTGPAGGLPASDTESKDQARPEVGRRTLYKPRHDRACGP